MSTVINTDSALSLPAKPIPNSSRTFMEEPDKEAEGSGLNKEGRSLLCLPSLLHVLLVFFLPHRPLSQAPLLAPLLLNL